VHLEADRFFDFIAAGRIEPWKAESHEQNQTVMKIVCDAAAAYADAGYFTIVEGIVIPRWFLEPLRAALGAAGHETAYAVLRLPLSTCIERVRGRDGALSDPAVVEQVWHEFADLGNWEANAIEAGDRSVDELAAVLADRLDAGDLLSP
jgi:hypothetical protein